MEQKIREKESEALSRERVSVKKMQNETEEVKERN